MTDRLTAVLITLGLALSPFAAQAADSGTKMENAKEAVKEELSDSAITTRIKADFAKDKQVSAMKIHVDTEKGVVKLTGTAKSKDEAEKAEHIAKNTKGVVSVKNDIKVGASAKAESKTK